MHVSFYRADICHQSLAVYSRQNKAGKFLERADRGGEDDKFRPACGLPRIRVGVGDTQFLSQLQRLLTPCPEAQLAVGELIAYRQRYRAAQQTRAVDGIKESVHHRKL